MIKKAIIFDLDDTIVTTGKFYEQGKLEFSEFMESKLGFPKENSLELLKTIDRLNTRLYGVSRERSPRSYSAATACISVMMGLFPDSLMMHEARKIADKIFDAPYPIINGARESLLKIKKMGFEMFLCTKGDKLVQSRKVQINDLLDIFPQKNIYIDFEKTSAHFKKIVRDNFLDKTHTASVGDSLTDDVKSALDAGITSIYIDTNTVHFMDQDKASLPSPHYEIPSLSDLPDLLSSKDFRFIS